MQNSVGPSAIKFETGDCFHRGRENTVDTMYSLNYFRWNLNYLTCWEFVDSAVVEILIFDCEISHLSLPTSYSHISFKPLWKMVKYLPTFHISIIQ